MAKTQLGVRVDAEVKQIAAARAGERGMALGDYIAQLVLEDASGLRARGLDAAGRFLAEHQHVFDAAEEPGGEQDPAGPGAHAA
ncbi:hypothetical protein AB0Q95_30035 [Streptomyces sp. NPDC059900]|uniref:hypothetical protein n=1 Tax=Streptomyces sp. NPDC059900 TaxID=3155816 RepID=UPI0034355228